MDFGRIPEEALAATDLTLVPEPKANAKVLKGKPARNAKVYMGCAKWGRKEWIGKIYPKGTKDANFLEEYVKHYNSIELNATHYKLFKEAEIQKWTAKVKGRDFKFCPKVYQGISHFGNLNGKQILTDAFLQSILGFEKHLGPVFFQVSDKFSPKRKDELFTYLQSLPKDLQFFVEVRHAGWFEPRQMEELFRELRKLKMGAVITDTAGRRDCCHMHLTIPKAFIRYVGNSLHPTDYTRIDEWVGRISSWLDSGLKEVYFFMHMHDEAYSPELSLYLAEKMNKVAGTDLLVPQFENQQPKVVRKIKKA
jgi:uncharacterized protein YecE (DUF72 family)